MFLSKSSLNTWLQCPAKFKYIYIDKCRPETSPQAQRGIEVHDFCNHFYDNISFKNGDVIVDRDFLEPYLEMCMEETKEQINNFIEFEQQRWRICRSLCPKNPRKLFLPLLREEKFVSEKLQQVTIVDRMDQRLDGNYTLVEYKSERFQEKEWKKTEFRREMMFEKITCETTPDFQARFPYNIVEFVVYFPRSNDVMMENFNYRTASALKKSIERMRIAIENSYYPCNVEYHCRFCAFSLGLCPMEFEK
jgi:hypothetical protein